MLPIEPFGPGGADEELGAVGAGPCVGHRKHPRSRVLLNEVLVRELGPIDGLPACPIPGGEVAALAHEPGDHPVELGPLVVEWLPRPPGPLLAGAERPEVLSRPGGGVSIQLHHDPAHQHTADRHVKEDLGVRHV